MGQNCQPSRLSVHFEIKIRAFFICHCQLTLKRLKAFFNGLQFIDTGPHQIVSADLGGKDSTANRDLFGFRLDLDDNLSGRKYKPGRKTQKKHCTYNDWAKQSFQDLSRR